MSIVFGYYTLCQKFSSAGEIDHSKGLGLFIGAHDRISKFEQMPQVTVFDLGRCAFFDCSTQIESRLEVHVEKLHKQF